MSDQQVALEPVDATNWRDVVELEVTVEQQAFVAPPARYLTMCAYDGVWTPLAIRADGRVVGMMMWAIDPEDGACWLGGILVDRRWQQRGIGRRAVALALIEQDDRFADDAGSGGFALSYEPGNVIARRTYAALGFVETGEMADAEVVARRPSGDVGDPKP